MPDPVDPVLVALLDDLDDDARVERIVGAVPGPSRRLRGALAVLAVVQAAVVLPWLVGRDPLALLGDVHDAHDMHLARDGALGVAVVAAAALTAWRPRWAVPATVIAAVALVVQLLAGLADGTLATMGTDEAVHALGVVTTVLVARAHVRLRPLAPRRRRLEVVRSPR